MSRKKTKSDGKSFPRASKVFWWIEKSLEFLGQQHIGSPSVHVWQRREEIPRSFTHLHRANVTFDFTLIFCLLVTGRNEFRVLKTKACLGVGEECEDPQGLRDKMAEKLMVINAK